MTAVGKMLSDFRVLCCRYPEKNKNPADVGRKNREQPAAKR